MEFDMTKILRNSPENGDNANFVKDDFDVRNARERCLKPNELPQ